MHEHLITCVSYHAHTQCKDKGEILSGKCLLSNTIKHRPYDFFELFYHLLDNDASLLHWLLAGLGVTWGVIIIYAILRLGTHIN